MTALPAPPANLALDGYVALLDKLRLLGVTVTHTDMVDDDAQWDHLTHTMHLRADAPIAHHIRDMTDFWLSQACPGHRTRAVPHGRRFRIVT